MPLPLKNEPRKTADPRPAHSTFSPEIEGLRAIAVLAVVAHHAKISIFEGGFVGVDMFFVISSYLISRIVFREMEAGAFSFRGFYARRMRRILPALAFMLLSVTVWACFTLLPNELEAYSKSALSAVASVANLHFGTLDGYFGAPSRGMPLLHTWSLAVEEQFYLVFPALIALLMKSGRRSTLLALGAIATASFAAGVWMVGRNQIHAFYHPQYRAWELLLGSFIALQALPSIGSRLLREVTAWGGIGLIGVSITTFDFSTPHPGFATLLPCLGTLLVILAAQSGPTRLGSILSLPAFGFVGKISYSVYLWHWPVMVFTFLDPSSAAVPESWKKGAMCAASIAFGWLSWRLVENPFRAPATDRGPARSLKPVLCGLAVASLAALVFIGSEGLPNRFKPASRKLAAFLDYESHDSYREDTCFILNRRDSSVFDRGKCLRTQPGKKNFLLVGDSHGAHLWEGLSKALPDVNILQATAVGCRPLKHSGPGDLPSCRAVLNFVFEEFLASARVDRLLLAGRWQPSDLPGLRQTLRWAKEKGIPVLLFGPILSYKLPLPRLLAFASERSEPALPRLYRNDSKELEDLMREAARETGAGYVSLLSALCTDGDCREYSRTGNPLQYDGSHLTAEGSSELVADLVSKGLVP